MYGNSEDYDVSKATDQMLVNLHQDWLLAKQMFKSTPRTDKMIAALEAELSKRNIDPVPYEWVPPRVYETKEANKNGS